MQSTLHHWANTRDSSAGVAISIISSHSVPQQTSIAGSVADAGSTECGMAEVGSLACDGDSNCGEQAAIAGNALTMNKRTIG